MHLYRLGARPSSFADSVEMGDASRKAA